MSEANSAVAPSRAYYDFTDDLLVHFPLVELSAALRACVERIILIWTDEVRASIPAASELPFAELEDNAPRILPALATALGSSDSSERSGLLQRSPMQGITRFQQHYQPRDLLFEDRLLRRHIVMQVTQELDRPMTTIEHTSLGMGLDLMSQQAVVAFIDHQSGQLRSAAEAELKYLSFLSHDLSNNLHSVTLCLQILRQQLQTTPGTTEQIASIDGMQSAVLTTIGGMGRLMQAERLRHGAQASDAVAVDLLSSITNQTRFFAERARNRQLSFIVEVPAGAEVVSQPDLIALILQNLIGNAVKFATPGTITIRASIDRERLGAWRITVEDQGPGIAPEQQERIFAEFARGTMQGETGVGLGLAIASRATALLGGTLKLDSAVGRGSIFKLIIPTS